MAERTGRRPLRLSRNPARLLAGIAVALFIVLIFGRAAATFYTDALWFRALGHSDVFWTRLITSFTVRLVMGTIGGAVILLNLWYVLRQLGPVHLRRRYGNLEIAEQVPRTMLIAGAAAVAVLAGWWLANLQFGGSAPVAVLAWLRHEAWGVQDPVFDRDISFYVFSLPIYTRLVEYLLLVLLWSLMLVAIGYVLVGAVRVRGTRWDIDERPRIHFAILVAAALIVLAARYWLGRYQLVFEGRGFGQTIGYTDVHARLPARLVISLLTAVLGGSLLYGVVRRTWMPAAASFALLLVAAIGMGAAYPAIVQKVQVEPNQLAREAEYIRWNLDFTRRAYGLDRIERRSLPYRRADAAVWASLAPTLERLPLWDAAQLQTAFNEIQAQRRYYQFTDVDYDRYGERAQQVAVGVREFDAEGLNANARTWQTLHMNEVYTRGMGVVASPAAEKQAGHPVYWLGDVLPVQRAVDAPTVLELTEPSVYFGETMSEYAIVGYRSTSARTDADVEAALPATVPITTGIPLGPFQRVLAFSLRFGEPNLLFAPGLNDSTRLIFRRTVRERVEALAPFIMWDPDALPIVLDGRVVWLLDGYTATANYPLSRAFMISATAGVRYLRSSAKATVDAVTGEVTIYALPDADPIVRTYRAIFPDLIADWTDMPAAVRAHLRYPPMLYRVQADVLEEFHLERAEMFYAGQDVWQLPQGLTRADAPRNRPGYMLATLPGGDAPEFLLLQPFLARERQNMTALLVARSDGEHYGELVLLEMPRDDQIKGPGQVHTIIEQDPVVSQQLSLWRQGGSTIELGQIRILPTDSSIVYVMPLFLVRDNRGIPQLQRVIVSDGSAVSMAEELGVAIAALTGQAVVPRPAADPRPAPARAAAPSDDWRRRALELMREADDRLRAGDFAGFGATWNRLRVLLEQRPDTVGGR